MPKYEQAISIKAIDTDTALAIAYEAFIKLEWITKFAGPDKLLALPAKDGKAIGQQMIVGVAGSQMIISSDNISAKAFDIGNRNQKNVDSFIAAFQAEEDNISEQTIEANRQAVNQLREQTQLTAEEDARHSAELEKVMHLSQRNLVVTYGIIAINVLVFAAMVINGVSLFEPSGFDIINWGGNFSSLTSSGEWWRLITNVFVHIGLIHILLNMYALYMIGIYLEPMLGKVRYSIAYLCTGIAASLVSLWWHLDNPSASAGASGAIFGMYGVFLALLSTSLIPKKVRAALLQSIGVFVVFNLFYGIKSGIDNAAHIGGLLSGLIIGYAYYFTLKKEFSTKKIAIVCAAIITLTVSSAYTFLNNANGTNTEEVKRLKNELNDAKYPDAKKYNTGIQQFAGLEAEAIKPFTDSTSQNNEQLANRLSVISEPKWQEASVIINKLKSYNVSENAKKKAELIGNYIQLRLQEIDNFRKIAKGEPNSVEALNTTRQKMQLILDTLKEL